MSGGQRPSTRPRSPVVRYGAVAVAVALASVVRAALTPLLGEGVPFILYFPTVVVCAWFGGLGPGLLSAALGGFLAWYLFVPPYYTLTLSASTGAQLTVFVLASTLISLLADSLHRARRTAQAGEAREREHGERFRVTLASIGDAVIATDADGRVTLMNDVAESLTGWTRQEASERRLEEVFAIVHARTRVAVENPARRAMGEGRIVALANDTVLIARGGAEVPIDDSGAPIRDADGRVLGAVLIFRDITERRRGEATFRRALEAPRTPW